MVAVRFPDDEWERVEKKASAADLPVTAYEVHVVRVFADGRRDVDDERTTKLRVEMVREFAEQERKVSREQGIDRGGMER